MKSRGHGCQLARKCDDAVAALMLYPTLKAAASHIGISELALRRWLRIPEFVELLQQARKQAFSLGLARLQGVVVEAVHALEKSLTSQNEAIRLKAADAVLTHAC